MLSRPKSIVCAVAVLLSASLSTSVRLAEAAGCDPAVLCPGTGACTINGTHSLANGCHLDFGSRSVTLNGTIRSETTGGSFSIAAGDLALSGGKLRADGTGSTAGGSISVAVTGTFRMSGAGGLVDVHANAGGGSVDVTATTIDMQPPAAINADGAACPGCGDGGWVSLAASGSLTAAKITAKTNGYNWTGGTIEITGANVQIVGDLDVSGGDGPGGISVTAVTGDLSIAAALDASGRGNDGEGSGAGGGPISLSADFGNVTVAGSLTSTGSAPDGSGGTVTVNVFPSTGTVILSGPIDVDGKGRGSSGGSIGIGSATGIAIHGTLTARGGSGTVDTYAMGGTITLEGGLESPANSDVTIASTLDVGAEAGGTVEISTPGKVIIPGSIRTRGGAESTGGEVSIVACEIEISGSIDVGTPSSGEAGTIVLVGGSTIVLPSSAALLALPCASLECIDMTTRSAPPTIAPGAIVNPPPVISTDPTLYLCCGNGAVDAAAGETCDDGNALSCDGCSLECLAEANPPCPDDGSVCTEEPVCVPTQGCIYEPIPCDDGIHCTANRCDPVDGCYFEAEDAACDDGSPCTVEACDPTAGDPESGCVYADLPDGTACEDDNLCTTGETCRDGICGEPACCDDGNPCTIDSCNPTTSCRNVESSTLCPSCTDAQGSPLPAGTPCTDGNNATIGDTCDGAGGCLPGAVRDCEDGNPCTIDSHDGFGGCTHFDWNFSPACTWSLFCPFMPDGTACVDFDVCTTGVCQAGTCISSPVLCDDGDPSNGTEICQGPFGPGCVRFPTSACSLTCGDGVLDPGEQCDDGNNLAGDCCDPQCQAEPAGSACADDGDLCTDDVCDGSGSCSHPANSAPCDDGDTCTTGDVCQGGSCAGSPGCDDGNPCTQNDTCQDGECTGEPLPRLDCRAPTVPGRGALLLRDHAQDKRDRLSWTWLSGAATTLEELGEESYTLCLYDSSAETPSVTRLATDGISCGGRPCWRTRGACRLYSDPSASQDGLQRMQLCAGEAGRAKIKLVAKGANLPLPELAALATPLTVQLHGSDVCWQASYARDLNPASDVFKSKPE